MSNITSNINSLLSDIKSISKKYNHSSPITLVAVTKNITIDQIEEAIRAGITNFGENYFQEALSKWSILKPKYPHVKLHFIGGIQANKLKKIINLCDVIQSLDSAALINKALLIEESTHKEFFIEIKAPLESYGLMGENRKGIEITNAEELINYAKAKKLPVKGIMGVAPVPLNLSEIGKNTQNYFEKLYTLKIKCKLPYLSMGMSNDYKMAIHCGSTMLRIGSKIFKC